MLRFACPLLIALALCSCAPRYTMHEKLDMGSPQGAIDVLTDGNRISTTSIAGGTHIDDAGVYINPYCQKLKDGTFANYALLVQNSESSDTLYGNNNALGSLQSLVFNADGKVITLQAKNSKLENGASSYNTVTNSAGHTFSESAEFAISAEDLRTIANAKALWCRITGTTRTAEYPTGDISKSFQVNLQAFCSLYTK